MLLRVVFYLFPIQGIGFGTINTDDVVIWDTKQNPQRMVSTGYFLRLILRRGGIFFLNILLKGESACFF